MADIVPVLVGQLGMWSIADLLLVCSQGWALSLRRGIGRVHKGALDSVSCPALPVRYNLRTSASHEQNFTARAVLTHACSGLPRCSCREAF